MNILLRNSTLALALGIYVFMGLVAPIAVGFISIIYASVAKRKKSLLAGLFFFLYAFVLINSNKVIDGDLRWYIPLYEYLSYGDFWNIFSSRYLGEYDYAKIYEPFYHFVTLILSRASSGNYAVYMIGVVFFSYVIPLIFVMRTVSRTGGSLYHLIAISLFFIFISVTFTLPSHFVRQYYAGGLTVAAAFFLADGRYRYGLVFVALAVLSHLSAIVFSIFLISTILVRKYFPKLNSIYFAALLGVSTSFVLKLALLLFSSESRLLRDDGAVDFIIKVADLFLYFTAMFFYFKCRTGHSGVVKALIMLYTSFIFFLIASVDSPYISLRYYFYLDFLRWIAVMVILSSVKLTKSTSVFLSIIVFVIGLAYIQLRMNSTSFDFGGGIFSYFLYPLI